MRDYSVYRRLTLLVLSTFVFSCGGNLAKEYDQIQETHSNLSTPPVTPSRLTKSDVWKDRLVAAGAGTDSVRLGMTRDELTDLLGKPNDELDYHIPSCIFSHMHWYHANPDGSVDGDIFAFLRDGKVFEIRYEEGFYTSDGIKNDYPLKDLKRKIAAPLFELTRSSNHATNYENLYFMIESEKGIAYEVAAGY
ncbi:MAG: hypothetical protein ACRD6X_17950, partial [Pyrinomonadaceae bacterium]